METPYPSSDISHKQLTPSVILQGTTQRTTTWFCKPKNIWNLI